MSAAVEPRTPLRTLDEIAAAGAEAVADWQLTDRQCDQLAACLVEARQVEARRSSERRDC